MLFLARFGYLLILVAAEIFVNAREHLVEKLHISKGVTGSLFAAVGPPCRKPWCPGWQSLPAPAMQRSTRKSALARFSVSLMPSTLSLCLMSVAPPQKEVLLGVVITLVVF